MRSVYVIGILLLTTLLACSDDEIPYDAYGHFEADEWTIGPEVSGKVVAVYADEGEDIAEGQPLCQIDTTELVLQMKKLQATWKSLEAKLQDPGPDVAVLEEREKVLLREIQRVENLLRGGAATQKQLDDLTGELDVVRRQKQAAIDKSGIANRGILSERDALAAEMQIIEDRIGRCTLFSPANARILVRNVEPGEVAMPGKVFFKLAAVDRMYLRAYIEGSRINEINQGQNVLIGISPVDTLEGTITWVSERAEFSPKFVETREERADRVYAFKIKVNNNGQLKIGMPGEVYLEENPIPELSPTQ